MILFEQTNDWPSRGGRMEHHPISVVIKHGQIIWARLYKATGPFGLVGETLHLYSTPDYWTCEGAMSAELHAIAAPTHQRGG